MRSCLKTLPRCSPAIEEISNFNENTVPKNTKEAKKIGPKFFRAEKLC